MNFTKLEKNICDVIKEEQIKLGYRKENVRLYYPLLSLNRFLHTDLDAAGMEEALKEFSLSVRERLGTVEITCENDRFCFFLPPEASEYVRQNTADSGFLRDLIDAVSRHGVSMEEVIGLFKKYSGHVHIEKMENEDFDYLVYFEDGTPDEFRYCLTDEGCHIIYHRFTADDYSDFYRE